MILTYKYRVKDNSAKRALRQHAFAVNQVWNYCVARQRDIEARYRAGAPARKWPTAWDLHAVTGGTSKELGILSDTISNVCDYFARSRDKARHAPHFRASVGSRRALGWIPFKARTCRIAGNTITYRKKRYRFWLGRRPLPAIVKGGTFVEDARGRWYVCFHVQVEASSAGGTDAVGIDLGLKTLATCSDGQKIENPRHFQKYAARLMTAQRAGNKARVRAIHAKLGNARRDFLHKLSTSLVRGHSLIAVGNISSSKLAKTRMAKSVLDAGWSALRAQLRYKSRQAGAVFLEVDEKFTTQVCSDCGVIGGPRGIADLGMRLWQCSACGASHDRDVNSALNILAIARRSAAPLAGESRDIPDRPESSPLIEPESNPPPHRHSI